MSLQTLLSGLTIYYFSFALSLDFSATLVSIEKYWLTLRGDPLAYGVVFGSYALAQTISSPIFGYLADRKGTKFALCVSIIVNAFGNGLYGLAYFFHSKNVIVFGRFLSGFGAGSLILGIVHITNTTSREDRGWVVANYRIAQSLAYLGGPLLGLTFVPLELSNSEPNRTETTKEQIVNFYTAPAWVAVLNNLFIMLPMVVILFKNPFAPHAAMRFYYRDAKALIYHTVVIGSILFFGNLCLWGVISKLLSFAAFAEYHIINEQSDLWKVYIAAGTAFLAGSLLLRVLIKSKLSAIAFSISGLAVNIVGFVFLLDLKVNEHVSSAFFYLGSVLTISGGMWFLTGTIVYYSQKLTDHSNQARNRRGLFMGILNIADAFGRFIGPAVLTPIMTTQSSNQLSCDLFTDWNPENCTLAKINVAIPINIALLFGNIIFFFCYHCKYGRSDFETSGSLVSHTSLSVRSQSQIQLEEVGSPDDYDEVFVENI